MSPSARSAATRTRQSSAMRMAARLGYAGNGLLNAMIGVLALGVVGAGSSGTADPNGALTGLAGAPGGQVLIWVIVVALVALAVWQFATAVQERGSDAARRRLARAKDVGKGVGYTALAVVGVRVALHAASGGAEEDLTARALATPGGVVLVVLLGLAALGIGGYLVVKGVRRTFRDDLALPGGRVTTAVTVLGVVGYVARGLAIGVIGVLFLVAAVTADAAAAGGLDDALAALATLPAGSALLVAVGVGFIAYGVYGFARARFARL